MAQCSATTRCSVTICLILTALGALGGSPALAQEASWRDQNDSGWKALKEGNYDQAQLLLRSAVQKAESFGPERRAVGGQSR